MWITGCWLGHHFKSHFNNVSFIFMGLYSKWHIQVTQTSDGLRGSVYILWIRFLHSLLYQEKRNRTPFFKLPLLTRNVIYGFRTYFRIPYSLRNAQNRSVFVFFINTHIWKMRKTENDCESVQCGMSFSVLPTYDPYLAIFYLVISILCHLDVGINKL